MTAKPSFRNTKTGELWCNTCRRRHPEQKFFPADVKIGRRRCRACALSYVTRRGPPQAIQRIMDRCRQTERRRYGLLMPSFSMDDLRAILRRHDANAALCPRMLVRRRDPTRPFSLENSAIDLDGGKRGRPRKMARGGA